MLIEGRLKLDTWEKDGKKNSKLRVIGEKMQLLGSKGGGGGGGQGANRGAPRRSEDESQYGQPAAADMGPPDEDIPF